MYQCAYVAKPFAKTSRRQLINVGDTVYYVLRLAFFSMNVRFTYIHTYTLFMLEIYRVAVELISSRK